jgi:hypothetical protein
MFKRGLFMAFMALISIACCKDNPSNVTPQDEQMGTLEVSVYDELTTRATSASVNDSNIENVQILIFSKGILERYGKFEDLTEPIVFTLPTGGVSCYAVANSSEDLSDIGSTTELNSRLSYLKNNSLSGFEMIGNTGTTITNNFSNQVRIGLRRFVAKIQIDKITPMFISKAYQKMEFKVTGIYLTNVNGSCPYDLTPKASSDNNLWYNKLKYESGDCDHLISDIFSEPVILQTSDGVVTPYQTTHSFFFYPNPTVGDSSSSTWSHRWTRLVVEATLDGTTYYYPVSFRNTYPNYLYKITDMKITGPGSTSPELPIIKRDFTVNLYIQDWTGETVQEVEY